MIWRDFQRVLVLFADLYTNTHHITLFSQQPQKRRLGKYPISGENGVNLPTIKRIVSRFLRTWYYAFFWLQRLFRLDTIFQALSKVDDTNLVWYTIFVIGYRLRSLRFVRGGETNESHPWAHSYYYGRRYSRNYLVFRLQMARW